jgi:hypothetical protein
MKEGIENSTQEIYIGSSNAGYPILTTVRFSL